MSLKNKCNVWKALLQKKTLTLSSVMPTSRALKVCVCVTRILVKKIAGITLLELTLFVVELTKNQDEISQLKQQLEKMKKLPYARVCVLDVHAC